MPVEILPALRVLTGGWVVKKSPSLPPERLVPEDLNRLAQASIATMMQRALGFEDSEWGELERATRGWVVQRVRGEAPSALTSEDYRMMVRFVLEGMTQERVSSLLAPDMLQQGRLLQDESVQGDDATEQTGRSFPESTSESLMAYVPETDETLPDGRKIADILREDPFYFAREHLALSL